MNPYEILGVSEDSDADTIKKAYRNLAKKHHPDIAEDGSAITDLTMAYSILSNPDKRKRYDETGNTEMDQTQSQVYAEFLKMSEEILLKQEGLPIKASVERIRVGLEQQFQEARTKNQRQIDLLEAAKSRITKTPEFDVLGNMIEQRLDDMRKGLAAIDRNMVIANCALALFDEYEIKEPEPRADPWTTVSGTMRW
jgi:DnaJ-class molecular chaperone